MNFKNSGLLIWDPTVFLSNVLFNIKSFIFCRVIFRVLYFLLFFDDFFWEVDLVLNFTVLFLRPPMTPVNLSLLFGFACTFLKMASFRLLRFELNDIPLFSNQPHFCACAISTSTRLGSCRRSGTTSTVSTFRPSPGRDWSRHWSCGSASSAARPFFSAVSEFCSFSILLFLSWSWIFSGFVSVWDRIASSVSGSVLGNTYSACTRFWGSADSLRAGAGLARSLSASICKMRNRESERWSRAGRNYNRKWSWEGRWARRTARWSGSGPAPRARSTRSRLWWGRRTKSNHFLKRVLSTPAQSWIYFSNNIW